MSWETLTIALYIATLLVLLGGGVWVGLALLGVGLIGIELLTTRPAGDAMATTIWSSLSSWPLVALPLFVWMGERARGKLTDRCRRGTASYHAARRRLQK